MTGVELIAAERERQKSVEGWTPEHDAQHTEGELALAGAIYAWPTPRPIGVKARWPWAREWWKPAIGLIEGSESKARIKDLVRAGALIAAEIDRIQEISR